MLRKQFLLEEGSGREAECVRKLAPSDGHHGKALAVGLQSGYESWVVH